MTISGKSMDLFVLIRTLEVAKHDGFEFSSNNQTNNKFLFAFTIDL